jgi:hypothetical protein
LNNEHIRLPRRGRGKGEGPVPGREEEMHLRKHVNNLRRPRALPTRMPGKQERRTGGRGGGVGGRDRWPL